MAFWGEFTGAFEACVCSSCASVTTVYLFFLVFGGKYELEKTRRADCPALIAPLMSSGSRMLCFWAGGSLGTDFLKSRGGTGFSN